ncbi:MAG: adenylate/guanylate cyclase domain-containing protein, partial [Candidatus Eremiobacteraeota bacterium]|nr:adenylate/guanylate cyclase domain-containing protein [Candidatus Eremiobacteraeota bacterium]
MSQTAYLLDKQAYGMQHARGRMMQAVAPAQTLTFLFTDIEGSTRMWERDAPAMRGALERHDRIARDTIEKRGGIVFKTVGDAFCAAFSDALDAALAAADLQRAIASESWTELGEFRVRAALHTGSVQLRDGDYFGQPLNQLSRLLSLVHGGQVLLSDSTERLLRDNLTDGLGLRPLGERLLKDVSDARHLYQLTFPGMLELFSESTATAFIPTNLSQELSSFVGRKAETTRIRKLLRTRRLITIVGAGGVGKTRLAQHVAREELQAFPGGVWFCELAQVHEAPQIEPVVANTLHLNVGQQDPFSVIAQSLGTRKTLIVLDNSEHIVGDVAVFARRLTEACPALTILTTSREALHVPGEQTVSLAPLGVPRGEMSIAEFKKCESVRLVLERAKLVNERFALSERNARAIGEICERLDGIPLALELAAAQLSTLSAQQIAERLSQRFALLAGSQSALDHHRTLRSAIDWTYDMLDADEQLLFARLAVFVGTFSVEAAEAICGSPPLERASLLRLLARLAQKSLLTTVHDEESARYRYLETVHTYALERLEALVDRVALEQLHFEYWTNVISLVDPVSAGAYDELERSHSDVHAALEWGLRERPLLMPGNVGRLSHYWKTRGYFCEGARFAETVASVESIDCVCRAQLFVAAAHMRNAVGEHEVAKNDAQRARELYEQSNAADGAADAIAALASIQAN